MSKGGHGSYQKVSGIYRKDATIRLEHSEEHSPTIRDMRHTKTIIGRCPRSRDKTLTLVGQCQCKVTQLLWLYFYSEIASIFQTTTKKNATFVKMMGSSKSDVDTQTDKVTTVTLTRTEQGFIQDFQFGGGGDVVCGLTGMGEYFSQVTPRNGAKSIVVSFC